MPAVPVTVTFDSNTVEKVARPDHSADDPHREAYRRVHTALSQGRLRGFFSQTYFTLEGIQKTDRAATLGATRVESSATSTAPNTINISVAVRHQRDPLHHQFDDSVRAVLACGMRALRGPARFVDGATRLDANGDFYAPDASASEMVARRERANAVASEIAARGVGQALAVELGNAFNGRADTHGKLWLQGLGLAKNAAERKRVARAVAEWSDGDGIGSHIACQIEFFCSHDLAKNAGTSIFDETNRAWLVATYGVKFVTIEQLDRLL